MVIGGLDVDGRTSVGKFVIKESSFYVSSKLSRMTMAVEDDSEGIWIDS